MFLQIIVLYPITICPDIYIYIYILTMSGYVMKQQVLLIALLKPPFWILWSLYLLTEHQSLLLIDSQLQCSVIRYAFATSQRNRSIFELIYLQPLSARRVAQCLFVSSFLWCFDESCPSFTDHTFEFQNLLVHCRVVNACWFHLFSDMLMSPVTNLNFQIIVLENGKVVEQGPHDVLLSKGGRYAELWSQQNNSDAVDPAAVTLQVWLPSCRCITSLFARGSRFTTERVQVSTYLRLVNGVGL